MLLAALVEVSRSVAATRSRLEKVEKLATCIRTMPRPLVALGVSYLVGELPQGKIGVGYAAVGALRSTAASQASLTLQEVDAVFTEVKAETGAGCTGRRTDALGRLFARATGDEQELLVRLLLGELRQGALEGVLVDGVARAFAVDAAAVRRAVMLEGRLPVVAAALADHGADALARFTVRVFQPLQPMLADSAVDVGDALTRLGDAAALEYKLDGARVQVHKDGDRVEVWSRALNRVTPAVPELVERVSALPARRLILDGEAIALGPDARPRPFQVTMRRFGRKLDVPSLRRELPLSVAFFDALVLDDDELIDRPLSERWAALSDATGGDALVPRLVTTRPDEAEAFVSRALADGHEGIVAKALTAGYRAGRRGGEWLKVKRAHTLDLVILAAEWGSGRRQGWLSNLHLGARDPHGGGFVMLGKTFKGMTDEVLRWQTEALLAREIGREGPIVHVRPELVAEIAFDGVQRSPYPGGVALRFARLKRYRTDKGSDQADTIASVQALAVA